MVRTSAYMASLSAHHFDVQPAGGALVEGLLTEISKTHSAVSHPPWSVGCLTCALGAWSGC